MLAAHRHDVVVIGARAAGAATALLLGRLGYDVVLLERAVFPADTVSTHQLARTGVVQLRRWGLLESVLAGGAPAIRQVTFETEDERTTRTIKDKAGVDLLLAPRRYVLDTIVADAAASAGVDVRFGVTVSDVRRDAGGRVVGVYGRDRTGDPVEIEARYVVGADGLGSRVARSVGAKTIEDRGSAGAGYYTYYGGIPWTGIELVVADRALTGVFPTNDGQACIWICSPSADAHAARRRARSREDAFTAHLGRTAPALAERLRSAQRTAAVTGMFRAPNIVRQAHGPGWLLVGDAGYHRDPITGHGLSDAYRDAEFAAVAIDDVLRGEAEEGVAFAQYQQQRDAALRDIFDITVALAGFPPVDRFVALQKRLSAAIDIEAAALAARPVPGDQPAPATTPTAAA